MVGTETGVGVAEPVKLLRSTLRPSACLMLFRWHYRTRDSLAAIDNKQLFCFLGYFYYRRKRYSIPITHLVKYLANSSLHVKSLFSSSFNTRDIALSASRLEPFL
jgi:hypothetical protein